VIDVLTDRARRGSRPGQRDDGHVVSLAIEGGGMRGVVSAGMCAVLEAAGLMASVDRVYGASAGAVNGCFAAAGQAVLWATTFEDLATKELIDPSRILQRRPVLDLSFLFETVIPTRKPLSEAALARGPQLRALAVGADDGELRVLSGFSDTTDLLAALRVCCSLPVVGGPLQHYRGQALLDGALLEPVPSWTPLREGTTHLLVLRTRPAAYRARTRDRLAEVAVKQTQPDLLPLVRAAGRRYNACADLVQRLCDDGVHHVTQVAVPPDSRLVRRLSTDHGRIAESLRAGAAAMARALYGPPARLMWQPVVYRPPGSQPTVETDGSGTLAA
jgi:predicted patatin/cPLA2 family phospholipase